LAEKNIGAIDVLKSTPRTNCGECGMANCMAFAGLAARGLKPPTDCPYIDPEMAERLGEQVKRSTEEEEDPREELLKKMRAELGDMDFTEAAERLGGWMCDDRIAIRVLGRVFEVDKEGGLHTVCHVNDWVRLPILNYILYGEGAEPTGEWITFRELPGAQAWARFFAHRCERTIKRLSDSDPDLFISILSLFGEEVEDREIQFDHCFLLHPLPKVPVLMCYSRQEGDFDSKFTVLFDRSVEKNLRTDAAYFLVQGIAEMFGKIMEHHGVEVAGAAPEQFRERAG